ncbi:long-chain-fatty-acid--CoA ligase [Aeromicrobium ginsengisoli]|uniref:Long-chain fatty acid--CoA ligase n=1 Tax=Aeromicrobium ginsengisoli TaxID=363867 RepID=A0A5M4FJU8_9ACTN|nr:long-chain fatty acid--CoA ligase [Aeromicrobium ginsengisoli]KAA1400252.1 long-chain fatty acid--CoA ligase [Aeromicrobium ginsengisoli]
MNANLATLLPDSAAHHGTSTAVRLDEESFSYRTVDRVSSEVAGLLRSRGVEPGDRVGLMLPNVTHFAAIYFGILRAGAVVVPMNPLLVRREVDYYLDDSGAREVFVWHEVAGAAPDHAMQVSPETFGSLLAGAEPSAEVALRAGDDTAVILYTSGTTGQPKGAELTHDNLRVNAELNRDLLGIGHGSTVLGCLPLFHSFGQTCALNATISAGATLTLLPRFDAERALDLLEDHQIEVFLGVPTMYTALAHARTAASRDLSRLRTCVSGGAALPVEVLREFEATFGCAVLEGYGLSETSPTATTNHPDHVRKVGSVGTPIEGVEVAVVDQDGESLPAGAVGEVVIRGHNVMKGYWRRPAETAAAITRDGWFHTGDLGRLDEDGYLFIVDRIKDLIIRGGYNVYPREVEEVAHQHPAVREVAVVGLPDARLGEEIGMAVALRDGHTVTADELRAFVRESVAPYKYPRAIWFVDELPKGPSGKIVKRAIQPPAPHETASITTVEGTAS